MIASTRSMQVLQQATTTAPMPPAAPAARRAAAPAAPAPAISTPDGWWDAVRKRNATLDALFYDVGRIRDDEARALAPWLVAEGAVLLVPPSGIGRLQLFTGVDEFVSGGGARARALAVAGVGSSALGAAAFGRNVADAVDGEVAVVVSGYGLADVVSEGMGAWFWFGTLNHLRHAFEPVDEAPASPARAASRRAREPVPGSGTALERYLSRDTRTVLALLDDERLHFDLAIGHSKGNLVLSEALFTHVAAATQQRRAMRKGLRLVTVSAAITMPAGFGEVVDVMGDWDWFGRLNSRPGITIDVAVSNAWHHTNTELPNHLPVTPVLRGILGS